MGQKRSFHFAFKSSIYSDRLLHVHTEEDRPDRVDNKKLSSEERQTEKKDVNLGKDPTTDCNAGQNAKSEPTLDQLLWRLHALP